jgi:hypothetical protein
MLIPQINFPGKGPVPGIEGLIAKQNAEGGRLILYRRIYTLFLITWTRENVRHVPVGGSRVLSGIWDSLLSVLFGIWGPTGMVIMVMFCALNLRGGIDVTAHFTDGPIDPLREMPSDPDQAQRDLVSAQWAFVGLGIFIIIIVIAVFGLPSL